VANGLVMRTRFDALGAAETYSPADELINRRRRTIGLFLSPVVFAAVLAVPLSSISPGAHRLAAICALVGTLWVSEALPMPVTALLGPTLAVGLGVSPAGRALAPFADPIVLLFLGSFALAEAACVHGLDRRIVLSALASRTAGKSPIRLLAVYAGITAALSMWISNTATTALVFPIGLAVVAHLARIAPPRDQGVRRFAVAMMLVTSFGASIGGIATPVGTSANLVGISMLERIAGVRISFLAWMIMGVTVASLLLVFLVLRFAFSGIRQPRAMRSAVPLVEEEFRRLGPLSVGQRNVLLAAAVTWTLWLAPGALALLGLDRTGLGRAYCEAVPESVGAVIGIVLLFILPVNWRTREFTLTWTEASRLDWGAILTYVGGLTLGELAFSTGLAPAVAKDLLAWMPFHTTFALTVVFTAGPMLLSEIMSNTSSAVMVVPLAIAVAQAAGVSPVEPAIGATMGASMGFLLPVATAPSAIVYSSGYVPVGTMMKHGLVLDLVALAVIVPVVLVFGRLVA
jgi:solute carrier family 13 (sodium-dependent dicarboxylate transporter), member 2/3/5